MYWNRSAADISTTWQAEIESKLESGATAVLMGGASANMATSLTTLLGLQYSILQRNDVATPLLVAGGNSATWLGLLLPPQPTGDTLSAPTPTLVYGGADEATYLAIIGLTTALASPESSASTVSKANTVTKANTVQEMGVQFAPRLQPGATTAWEMIPFVEVGEQPTPALVQGAATADPTGDWIAWGVLLLAFCLIFSALLI